MTKNKYCTQAPCSSYPTVCISVPMIHIFDRLMISRSQQRLTAGWPFSMRLDSVNRLPSVSSRIFLVCVEFVCRSLVVISTLIARPGWDVRWLWWVQMYLLRVGNANIGGRLVSEVDHRYMGAWNLDSRKITTILRSNFHHSFSVNANRHKPDSSRSWGN